MAFSIKRISFPNKKKNKETLPENQEVAQFNLDEPKRKSSIFRKFRYFLGFVFILLFTIVSMLVYVEVYQPYLRIKASGKVIEENAKLMLKDLENKDISTVDIYFNNIKIQLESINKELDRYKFLDDQPLTKEYYENFIQVKNLINKTTAWVDLRLPEVKDLLKSSGFSTEKIINDKSQIANVEASSGKPEESSLNLIVKDLPKYLALYDKLEPEIIDLAEDLKKIDINFITTNLAKFKPEIAAIINDKSSEVIAELNDFPATSAKIKDLTSRLPDLLGSNKEVTYLLLLQNEAEMRSSGGLITAFGTVKVKNGEVGNIDLEDSWNLQKMIWYLQSIYGTWEVNIPYNNIYGQSYLMNHGCGATELRVQDAGIYPDHFVTADMVKDYYEYAVKYYPETYSDYDHVIILNNTFSENLLKLVEPLTVNFDGKDNIVTSGNLYDYIKSVTDAPEYRGDERKSILGDIADAAKKKLFDSDSSKLPDVLNTVIHSFLAKDISLISPRNEEMQKYFDKYGFTARTVKDFKGDYFQLGEAQNCSLKLNRWVRTVVTQDIHIPDDGAIRKDINIKWSQSKVYETALMAQYDFRTQFAYRAWVRAFMPLNSTNITSDGYSRSDYLAYTPVSYDDDIMDKTVSDNIVWFDHRRMTEEDPIAGEEMNISYSLPSDLNYNKTEGYSLLLQKHPGKSWGEHYKLNFYKGDEKQDIEVVLDQDKVVTYKNGIISVENYDKRLEWLNVLLAKIPWEKMGENK